LADCFLYISGSGGDAYGRAAAVDHFARLCEVVARDQATEFAEWLTPLRGHDLACWCRLDQTCHADVLLDLANGGTA